ncbi:hypothetical protein L1887_06726 [Cichorium endivia]|nr:hypothetical protein L1887_06726 [Cichorium endivia]
MEQVPYRPALLWRACMSPSLITGDAVKSSAGVSLRSDIGSSVCRSEDFVQRKLQDGVSRVSDEVGRLLYEFGVYIRCQTGQTLLCFGLLNIGVTGGKIEQRLRRGIRRIALLFLLCALYGKWWLDVPDRLLGYRDVFDEGKGTGDEAFVIGRTRSMRDGDHLPGLYARISSCKPGIRHRVNLAVIGNYGQKGWDEVQMEHIRGSTGWQWRGRVLSGFLRYGDCGYVLSFDI